MTRFGAISLVAVGLLGSLPVYWLLGLGIVTALAGGSCP